jgi:hypothetical protein
VGELINQEEKLSTSSIIHFQARVNSFCLNFGILAGFFWVLLQIGPCRPVIPEVGDKL